MKKTNFFRQEFKRRFHENVYEINGKYGIRLEMHHDNTIEAIHLPDGFFDEDHALEKLIHAINDAIATVSEQFADELRDTIVETMHHIAETGEIPNFDLDDLEHDAEEEDEDEDEEEEEEDEEPVLLAKPKDPSPS